MFLLIGEAKPYNNLKIYFSKTGVYSASYISHDMVWIEKHRLRVKSKKLVLHVKTLSAPCIILYFSGENVSQFLIL
jgi:hypothetical protein